MSYFLLLFWTFHDLVWVFFFQYSFIVIHLSEVLSHYLSYSFSLPSRRVFIPLAFPLSIVGYFINTFPFFILPPRTSYNTFLSFCSISTSLLSPPVLSSTLHLSSRQFSSSPLNLFRNLLFFYLSHYNISLPFSQLPSLSLSLLCPIFPVSLFLPSSHTLHLPTFRPSYRSGGVEYNRYCFTIAVEYNPLASKAPLPLRTRVGSGPSCRNTLDHQSSEPRSLCTRGRAVLEKLMEENLGLVE